MTTDDLPIRNALRRYLAWFTRAEHRDKAQQLRAEINRAFTEHPLDTGETYWEHLWFTATMAARIFYAMLVLMIHGLFPFLLTRTASEQIEIIYRIMKTRIPKSRRDVLDSDDYSV